ncbi:MAG TPA: hypothetical protein VFI19_17540 [Nocardioides sp.]|nr:hypothetical protein [Nocardioides sp.]
MVVVVRMIRVALILVLALFTVSFVIGIADSTTGWIEKVVLGVLIVLCVFLAARVTATAMRLQRRFARH